MQLNIIKSLCFSLLLSFIFSPAFGQENKKINQPAGPLSFAIQDYFILAPNSFWQYRGDEQTPAITDDNFRWDIDATKMLSNGATVSQMKTTTVEPTDNRNGDIDYWTFDGSGNLLFHGYFNATEDSGSAGVAIPAGDILLDQPFVAGSNSFGVGQVFQEDRTVEFSGQGTVTVRITVTYRSHIPGVFDLHPIPAGDFSDVLNLSINIQAVSVTPEGVPFPFPIDPPIEIRDNEFFLARGAGMICQDQNGDINDAQIQALWDGQVNGVKIPFSTGPTANAGDDQSFTISGSPAQLDGSGSTGATSFLWTLQDGPVGGTLMFQPNNMIESPTVTADIAGDYTILLTVSDGATEATDTVALNVQAAPDCSAIVAAILGRGNLADLSGDLNGDGIISIADISRCLNPAN